MEEDRKKEVGKLGMCELADVKFQLMPSQGACLGERSWTWNQLVMAGAFQPLCLWRWDAGTGGKVTPCLQQPRLSHTEEDLFNSACGAQPRSGCSFDFTPSPKCPWLKCEMTGAAAGQPCGLALGDQQDVGKGLPTFAQLGLLCQGARTTSLPTKLSGTSLGRL